MTEDDDKGDVKGHPPPESEHESSIAQKIKESAGQIWLAGLGAYAKAEKEGNKLFDNLVRDGEQVEERTKEADCESEAKRGIDRQFAAYRERVEEVKDRASSSWERLEKAFDQRVSSALGRLNIPTKRDIEELRDRIDQLSSAVEKIVDVQSVETAGKGKPEDDEK